MIKTNKFSITALSALLIFFGCNRNRAVKLRLIPSVSTIQFDTLNLNESKIAFLNLYNPNLQDSIKIKNQAASCGCTIVDVPVKTVPPRQSVKIKILYNATSKGSFKKNVVFDLSSDTSFLVLNLTGIVN
jgi:hypothetical protein